jgi:hypothetical protein
MKTIATLTMAKCFHETQGAKVSRVTVAVDTFNFPVFSFKMQLHYLSLQH